MIDVLVVHEFDILREGIVAILGEELDIRVVGQASSNAEAVQAVNAAEPAVVVLDQRGRGGAAYEVCRQIAASRPATSFIMITAAHPLPTPRSEDKGLRIVIVPDPEPDDLKFAVRATNGAAVSRGVVSRPGPSPAVNRPPAPRLRFAPHHLRVLRALGDGRPAKEIGALLGLSHDTVKSYMREIYRTLGSRSRSEAVAIAERLGLLREGPEEPEET